VGEGRARLRDIAEKTGFSANTVSLALRDSPRIPEATRVLIRQAADDMNYLPNRIARSLVSQRSMTVGLVLTDIMNPILTQVAQEVAGTLADSGYATMLAASSQLIAREKAVLNALRERQADGVLVYPTEHRHTEHLHKLRASGLPIVSLSPDPHRGLDTVSSNDMQGALKGTLHLLERGRRRVALVDSGAPLGNTEKLTGYERALAESGLSLPPQYRVTAQGHGVRPGYEAMARAWAEGLRPDGVIACNDSVALGVELWLHEHGVSIPGDVALVGFDDIEYARVCAVPITTIAYPVAEIARTAVAKLLALIDLNGPLPPPEETAFEPALIVRASTGG
jgi:LacI family transcriptional regulator